MPFSTGVRNPRDINSTRPRVRMGSTRSGVPRQYTSTQTGLLGPGGDGGWMRPYAPLAAGRIRSARLTRGEPRPVHTTLIATCRVYNSVVVLRRITPGLSPGYEPRKTGSINVLSSRGTRGGVCRAPQPAPKHVHIYRYIHTYIYTYK